MGVNSCSVKYLDKAYIGVSVRLTGGKNCVKFDNKPMKDVEIINYNGQGFRISHKDLPKVFWLDFGQLPLTKLKIENGIIKDEITFVENIIRHETQFIKTSEEAYINAKAEFELDKTIDLLPLSKLKIGQKIISAQCKDSIELIYLGNFFSTEIQPIYPTVQNSSYSWSARTDYSQKPKWSLGETPEILKRAYFLRVTDIQGFTDVSKFPKPIFNAVEKKFYAETLKVKEVKDWYARHKPQAKLTKLKVDYAKELFDKEGIEFLYEIVEYPVTNKYVKQLLPVGISEEHTDTVDNLNILISQRNFDFYCHKDFKEKINQYFKNYNYSDRFYKRSFFSAKKKTILTETEEFIKTFYNNEYEDNI